jgi:hypothetical protein
MRGGSIKSIKSIMRGKCTILAVNVWENLKEGNTEGYGV